MPLRRHWAVPAVMWLLLAGSVVVPSARQARGPAAAKPDAVVTWALDAPATVRPGTSFAATLRASVAPGWKFYAMEQPAAGPRPLKITVADAAFVIEGAVTPDTPPVLVQDTIWSSLVAYHAGATAFRLTLRPSDPASRDATLRVTVRYQACSDELCLRPTQTTIERHLAVR
jgi:DsbC/DsbD-like thiol-disulfide interchange protein